MRNAYPANACICTGQRCRPRLKQPPDDLRLKGHYKLAGTQSETLLQA
jgi:hypothetical protein